MSLVSDVNQDLSQIKDIYRVPKNLSLCTNRGVHTLICYRSTHLMYRYKIPLLPLVLIRLIQIMYAIDIDYRAKLEGHNHYSRSWSSD